MIHLPLVIATCHPRPMVHIMIFLLLHALTTCLNPPHPIKLFQASLDQHERTHALRKGLPEPSRTLSPSAGLSGISEKWNEPTWESPAGAFVYTSRSAIKASPETSHSAMWFSLERNPKFWTTERKPRVPPTVGVFWDLTTAKTTMMKTTTTKLTTKPAKARTKITNDPSTTPRPRPAPNITPTATALDITNPTMINLRSSGGKAKDMVRELEKIRQMNKKN
jgi:hypothetical protein